MHVLKQLAARSLWLVLLTGPAAAAEPLDERLAEILPSRAEDRWLEIPWRTNLADARAEASQVNKPVLLWVMNGNPLGCA